MSTSILDPQKHERLLQDFEHVRSMANVPKEYIHTSMVGVCPDPLVEWVRHFNERKETGAGVVLINHPDTYGLHVTAALVRNFVDARVVPLNVLLHAADSPGGAPDPTVLVVPNFYQKSYGKTLPAWKVSSLYDVLLSRYTSGNQTVLSVEDLDSLQMSYGHAILEHLKAHYTFI